MKSRRIHKDPLPAPRRVEVVPLGEVAAMLGWTASRVRIADFFLLSGTA